MARVRSVALPLVLAAAVAALMTPHDVAAQAVAGTISGTVVDQQGQVIPGATLTIVNEATNDLRVSVTDDRGNFQVTNLQPASYTVRVEMQSSDARTEERRAQRGRTPLRRYGDTRRGQPG
jgi:protocatechuate 3,4-dioxygenase beta subunit